MDRKAFFDALKKRESVVFGTRLGQGQVDGLAAILDEAERVRTPLRWLAYILATTYHEVGGKMQPIREGFAKTDAGARRAVNNLAKKRGPKSNVAKYAKPDPVTGHVYYGRGFPQLTWKSNYEHASKEFGVDFVNNPDLVMEMKWSVKILFVGMVEGWFTTKKLADYPDYLNMRMIINGMDQAEDIAGYAVAFEKALKAAGYGLVKQPAPVIPPEPVKPPAVDPVTELPPPAKQEAPTALPKPSAITAVGAGLTLMGAALWAKWEAFSTWIGGLF